MSYREYLGLSTVKSKGIEGEPYLYCKEIGQTPREASVQIILFWLMFRMSVFCRGDSVLRPATIWFFTQSEHEPLFFRQDGNKAVFIP